jgi:hypothetical protein
MPGSRRATSPLVVGHAHEQKSDTGQLSRRYLGPALARSPASTRRSRHSITAGDNPLLARSAAPHCEASLCQPPVSEVSAGARGCASGGARGFVVRLVVGSGSDLSEEPAVQDVEPVTLDFVSCLIVLPGLPITAGVGERPRPAIGRSRWRVAA